MNTTKVQAIRLPKGNRKAATLTKKKNQRQQQEKVLQRLKDRKTEVLIKPKLNSWKWQRKWRSPGVTI
ncbi:Uncharacterised protein [Sphingobacterium multivorum]|uniref:Uncharacterized protein n=1 Tax=Sphingobacterium multivorum TaxID=28454 RepID=A0A2X2IUK9_SPHMU|nr:hypothetical protein [Sphingobacterium multivorum]SPZ85877.1 Uncharacterised protein [Sphingobacterium multivorum]